MRYWAKMAGATIISVESYSHDYEVAGLKEITQTEFNDFIASIPPTSSIDWKQEWLNAGTTISERLKVIAQRLGFV